MKMTAIQTMQWKEQEVAISAASLAVLARVGLVCGPVTVIDVMQHGRLAIIRVEPLTDPDPVLPIPQVDAGPTAWARLREFYRLLTRLNDPQRSGRLRQEAHEEALAMIPKIAAAFSRYLDRDELIRFEHWLAVSLTGTPEIRGL